MSLAVDGALSKVDVVEKRFGHSLVTGELTDEHFGNIIIFTVWRQITGAKPAIHGT